MRFLKALLCSAALCIFAVILPFCSVFAEENEGNSLSPVFPELSDETAALLTDGDYSTVSVCGENGLKITCEDEFSYVYIIRNDETSDFNYAVNGETYLCDDNFLHQLIKLNSPAKEILLESISGEICDIYLFAEGILPDFVQDWENLDGRADIMIFSAHGDDEFLMFGGTIPYYAGELGLRVQVCYMTNHWREQPRPHEQLDGLWAAGVRNYPVFGIISDIPMQPIWTLSEAYSLYDEQEALGWFTEQVRRFKPSVIITHDKNGEYGHGAHKMAADIVMKAADHTADESFFPESAEEYGVWDVPKIYLHFWEENAIQMDWEIPLESFGGITAREAAELCFQNHKSQLVWGYSVNYGENWDCRQFGLYRSLVGNDDSADFMDNITPVSEELSSETTAEETAPTEETTERTAVLTTTTAAQAPENSEKTAEKTYETEEISPERKDESMILLICAAAIIAIIAAIILIREKILTKRRK